MGNTSSDTVCSKETTSMPWNARDTMSLRLEFVHLALQPDANRRELCRRFGVSPKTAYKWLARHGEAGDAALADRSRRPSHSPSRTVSEMEAKVVALRRAHPAWGGRKISRRLIDLGLRAAPAPSTVTDILRRHGLIEENSSAEHTAWQRFEHAEPNQLWQIDFKGYFDTPAGRCHPLTVLDDHSRFNLVLGACARTDRRSVQPWLTQAFRRYGLPVRMNADNGAPWGTPRAYRHGISPLTVWLVRLGVRVSHSRPAHPQTNGKDERFHRSLKVEVLVNRSFEDLPSAQRAFDRWRVVYNHERPHEALEMNTPVSRYRVSARTFPEVLAPIEYGPDDQVLRPDANGWLRFRGRPFKMPKALHRQPVAFRPRATQDGVFDVYFCHQRFTHIDLRKPTRKE
jgi:transposase InsO family protein